MAITDYPDRPVDLRAVTPMVFDRGSAVYVDLVQLADEQGRVDHAGAVEKGGPRRVPAQSPDRLPIAQAVVFGDGSDAVSAIVRRY